MYYRDELYHFGVKGMKWKGHVYATKDELKDAKRKYKEERKEIKRDAKKIAKYGNPGSIADRYIHKGKSSKIYNEITISKGEEYAKKVHKQSTKQLIGKVAAITIGASVVTDLLFDFAFFPKETSQRIGKTIKNVGRKTITGINKLRGIKTKWVD